MGPVGSGHMLGPMSGVVYTGPFSGDVPLDRDSRRPTLLPYTEEPSRSSNCSLSAHHSFSFPSSPVLDDCSVRASTSVRRHFGSDSTVNIDVDMSSPVPSNASPEGPSKASEMFSELSSDSQKLFEGLLERSSERRIDRQNDRQNDRQSDRNSVRQSDRHSDRHSEGQSPPTFPSIYAKNPEPDLNYSQRNDLFRYQRVAERSSDYSKEHSKEHSAMECSSEGCLRDAVAAYMRDVECHLMRVFSFADIDHESDTGDIGDESGFVGMKRDGNDQDQLVHNVIISLLDNVGEHNTNVRTLQSTGRPENTLGRPCLSNSNYPPAPPSPPKQSSVTPSNVNSANEARSKYYSDAVRACFDSLALGRGHFAVEDFLGDGGFIGGDDGEGERLKEMARDTEEEEEEDGREEKDQGQGEGKGDMKETKETKTTKKTNETSGVKETTATSAPGGFSFSLPSVMDDIRIAEMSRLQISLIDPNRKKDGNKVESVLFESTTQFGLYFSTLLIFLPLQFF